MEWCSPIQVVYQQVHVLCIYTLPIAMEKGSSLPHIQCFSFSSSLKLSVLCVCAEVAQGSSSALEQGRGRGEEVQGFCANN